MCEGISLAEVFSALTGNLITDEHPLIEEDYDFQNEASDEVQIVGDFNEEICCQHLINFLENHLFPKIHNLPGWPLSPQENQKLIEKEIDSLLLDNCKEYIDRCRKSIKNPKIVEKYSYVDKESGYIAIEFDKCVKGEEFYFNPDWVDRILYLHKDYTKTRL